MAFLHKKGMALLLKPSAGRFLASLRTVEEDPDRQIVRESFEPVHRPGRCEQEITGTKGLPFAVTEEPARSADDDVNLVSSVRVLRIDAARGVYLHLERLVPVHLREPLSLCGGNQLEGLAQRDPMFHDLAPHGEAATPRARLQPPPYL